MAAADTRAAPNTNGASDRRNNSHSPTHETRPNDTHQPIGLGIDEEIKIRKPRKPLAKLDEERLLSHKGIPKLRKITKERLKFKGKGHEVRLACHFPRCAEACCSALLASPPFACSLTNTRTQFSDVAKVLTLYQLWLDDLFPKANFADGLAMIEKLGHSKRMRVMRSTWIDEEKPRAETRDGSDDDGGFVVGDGQDRADDGLWQDDPAEGPVDEPLHPLDDDGEDIYSAPKDASVADSGNAGEADVPDDEDLDALMTGAASNNISAQRRPQTGHSPEEEYDFADEEEALASMW